MAPKQGWWNVFLILHHSSHPQGTWDLPLQRECLGLGATSFQPTSLPMSRGKPVPGPHIQNKNPLQISGFMQTSEPPSAQFLQLSFFPSASLQPLRSNNQPSYAALVMGCEAAPLVFRQHLPLLCFSTQTHTSPPSAEVEASARHAVGLKLMLLCKGQKHLKANTHRRVVGACVPQTPTEAKTPKYHGWLSLPPSSSTTSSLSPLLKPRAPTFTVPQHTRQTRQAFFWIQRWPHHKYIQHKYSLHDVARKSLRACSEFGSMMKWLFQSNSCERERGGWEQSSYYIPFPHLSKHSCKVHQHGGTPSPHPLLLDKGHRGEFKHYASVTKLKT